MAQSTVEYPKRVVADLTEKAPIRVLHVDDEVGFLKAAKPYLEMQGNFEVEVASSVEEALEKMKQKEYDTIVSDYVMPGRDGLQFLKELRDSGNNIPFIIFTGKGREEVAIKALNLGADQYLNKTGYPETVYGELAHGIRKTVERKKALEELVRLSSAVKMSIDGIVIGNIDAKIIEVNKALLKMYGSDDRGDLIGKNSFDLIAPEDREKAFAGMKETLEKGYTRNREYHIIIKDGSKILVEMNSATLKDMDGKPIGFVSIIRDITERKRMEEVLRESEAQFRNIFESASECMIYLDRSGRILDVNRKAVEVFGGSKEELLGKHFTKVGVISARDIPRLVSSFAKGLTGKKATLDLCIKNKKGQEIHLECSAASMQTKDKLAGRLIIARDITERKRTKEASRISEEKYRSIVELAPDSIMTFDRKGVITSCNTASTRLSGYSKDELIGKHFAKIGILRARDIPKYLKMIPSTLRGKVPKPFDVVYRRKDGTLRIGEVRMSLIREGDKTIRIQAIMRDITKRRQMEKALEQQRDIAITLSAARSLNEALNRLFGNLLEIEEFDCAGFYLVDKDTGDLDMIVHRGLPEEFVEKVSHLDADSPYAKVVMQGKPIYQKTSDFPPVIRKDLESDGILSVVAIPIQHREKIIGDLNLASHAHNEISASTRHLLEAVGTQVGEAIIRARMEEKLRESQKRLETMNEKLGVVGKLTRHDARNKLSTVTANTFIMKQKLADDPEALKHLSEVELACQQVERIFDSARIYEMLGAEELVYLDMAKTLEETVQLFSDLKGAKAVNDCHGLTLLADSLLRQIFYNLIDNSLKHGEKVSQIRVHYEEEGKDKLRLVYEDDGVGIPKAEKEKIFHEGYGKGSGYGLFLIRKMCEVYDWTIKETGRQGKGAQFTISIPKTGENGKVKFKLQ